MLLLLKADYPCHICGEDVFPDPALDADLDQWQFRLDRPEYRDVRLLVGLEITQICWPCWDGLAEQYIGARHV